VSPLDQRAVRQHNLSLVIRHVATYGVRSRAAIAVETGLNKATVSSLVAELIGRGLVVESAHTNVGTVGRPSRGVELAGNQIAGIGLCITEKHLRAYGLDLTGAVRFDESLVRDNPSTPPHEVLTDLATLASDALAAFERERITPVGVTVALPGLVDMSTGKLFVAPNLNWSEIPVVDLLRERLGSVGFRIHAENDANLAALAELWDGAGRRLRDFVYVDGGFGAGVGAGIVAGGELFRGAAGLAGEFGHTRVSRRGPRCRCGSRGCLENFAGWDALIRRAGLNGTGEDSVEILDVLRARAEAGERRTLEALSEVASWLSLSLVSLTNLLGPQAVVLGGCYAALSEWLVPRVEQDLRLSLSAPWSPCRVLVSELGREAAIRGAAGLALHQVLHDPTAVGGSFSEDRPYSDRTMFTPRTSSVRLAAGE
jgi:predicted NBD/HSP70 family sugar kinase